MGGGALLALWPAAALAKDPVVYAYDSLGRLTSATYPNGVTITYTYDAAGNRTQVVAASTPPPPPPPPPGPLSATASGTSWTSNAYGTSDPIAVTITGGAPPYYLTWQKVSGNPATYADNPNGTPTGWYFTGQMGFPYLKNSIWRCQVSDAASTTVHTANVSVSIDVS